MKLHLYQNLRYLCISRDIHPFDHLKNLKHFAAQCSEAGIAHTDEDIITVLRDNQNISASMFGAGPEASVESLPDHLQYMEVPKGDYLFYQFSDAAEQGIKEALKDAQTALYQKGWSRKGEDMYLRGVKEGPWYALQIIIPLA